MQQQDNIIVLSDSWEKIRLWANSIVLLSNPMKPILPAATLAAGIGVTATSASAQYDIASETARGAINGIILGGKVGPDFYGFVPANIESRVMASAAAQIGARICSGADPQRSASTGRLNRGANAASE